MDAPDWRRYLFLVARTALKLRHHGAASPARVAAAALYLDAPVADQKNAAPFFDAARSGEVVSVVVATAWRRDIDGRLAPDPKLSKAVSVGAAAVSMSGRDLVDAVRTAEPGAFEDIDSIMEDLGGWRTGTISK